MRLAGGGLAMLGMGAVTYAAMTRIAPGQAISEYGIPAVGFGLGAIIAKRHPMLGGGMALGALSPFVLPVAQKVVAALPAPAPAAASTAAGIGRAFRTMRAVDMGAVDLGAVDYR